MDKTKEKIEVKADEKVGFFTKVGAFGKKYWKPIVGIGALAATAVGFVLATQNSYKDGVADGKQSCEADKLLDVFTATASDDVTVTES